MTRKQRFRWFPFVLLPVLVLGACKCGSRPLPPLPPDPPGPLADAGFDPSTIYGQACARLRALGCPEGAHADCDNVMARADARHLTLVPAACIASAETQANVQACGGFARCR
jgi:hypothetical protein